MYQKVRDTKTKTQRHKVQLNNSPNSCTHVQMQGLKKKKAMQIPPSVPTQKQTLSHRDLASYIKLFLAPLPSPV